MSYSLTPILSAADVAAKAMAISNFAKISTTERLQVWNQPSRYISISAKSTKLDTTTLNISKRHRIANVNFNMEFLQNMPKEMQGQLITCSREGGSGGMLLVIGGRLEF